MCNPDHPGSPCFADESGRITYYAVGFGRDGSADQPDNDATFNVVNPSISTGMLNTVAPSQVKTQLVTTNAAEFSQTPPRGVMVFSHDNMASTEAQLIPFT